jgi:TetR/AcrR family transcriptional repressor of nem operon
MRYSPEHKAETHRKIVKDASRRLRSEGLSGAAVSAVMHDNGLTHGGFYKHFASKDALLLAALHDGFHEIADRLAHAAEQSPPGAGWKAIVKTYLSLESCEHVGRGCPLPALIHYKNRMVPFMPGRRIADKERAFFVIFSTMTGAIEIARLLPDRSVQKKVLTAARDFILRSF